MAKQLTLEDKEIRMILAALEAVSPSGGGSCTHSLYMKIAPTYNQDLSKDDAYHQYVGSLISNAWNEYNEGHGFNDSPPPKAKFSFFGMPTQDYFVLTTALVMAESIYQERSELYKDKADDYAEASKGFKETIEMRRRMSDEWTGKVKPE